MELTTVWFVLIAVLWIGYFVLEGFDFGVGMLVPILGRNDRERRVVITGESREMGVVRLQHQWREHGS